MKLFDRICDKIFIKAEEARLREEVRNVIYKLFIQVDRDGVLENLFFETIEELTAKKEELDAEITAATPSEGEVEPEAEEGGGAEGAPAAV